MNYLISCGWIILYNASKAIEPKVKQNKFTIISKGRYIRCQIGLSGSNDLIKRDKNISLSVICENESMNGMFGWN